MDYEAALRKHRKKLVADPGSLPVRLRVDRSGIERILPHREPFLLLDRLTGLDPEAGIIVGSRIVPEDDPVFRGHFPDHPVYPGVLELEMIGQVGLCLHYFLEGDTTEIAPDARPVAVRATRTIGAYYMEPVRPGDEVILIAQKLDYDGFFARILGQVVAGGKVSCVAASEGYLPEPDSDSL